MVWGDWIVTTSVLNDCLGLYSRAALGPCDLIEVALIVRLLVDRDARDADARFEHSCRHHWVVLSKRRL